MIKNKKINTVVILLVTLIVLFFALKDDFYEKIGYLFSFKFYYLIFAVVLMCAYWFLKSLVIYYCARKFNDGYSLKKAIKMLLDTQFFNSVTPFSTGGQPYQIYRFKKQGFPLEQGTNIIIQDFIVYQISLILLGTIAIISNYYLGLFPINDFLKRLVLLGYLINVFVIIVLFALAFNKRGNRFLLNLAVRIGAKFKIIKDKNVFFEKTEVAINNFHKSAVILMNSKAHFVKIILLNFIALVLLYLVPYVLILGLGEYMNPLLVIVTSAYVMLIGSFVPIPGGSGGIEYGFVMFFGLFISGAKLSIIMLTWRFITYYLGLFVGGISLSKGEEEKCE